ncbi:DUF1003 domain-containing protein [Leptotrichia sp. oral taxon 847]|uniref:DUF1003 domain-containing protein n=1 Tax=Leptotrichia sp. oral taxon 847 TaxID=1785996 RepID=UPI000767F6D4|nr:DUF1003 domain-containing protein [Leptotrichia sp. oral taxon 847]AMD94271.1 hypothetical protein AXF11_00790 [Leptotrichia sp. oral taxon 847]
MNRSKKLKTVKTNSKGVENKEVSLKQMLKSVDDDLKREEIIHMLLEQKVSKVIKEEKDEKTKISNRLSKFIGSKKFVSLAVATVAIWLFINLMFISNKKFDSYSFIILNAILSFVMLLFCSLIIVNQNKSKKLDEKKSLNDYKVNLKNEIVIEDLHYKLDELIKKQNEIARRVSQLENRKNAVGGKEKRAFKFIDITEMEKEHNN